jgi:tellurite resistance protein TerC
VPVTDGYRGSHFFVHEAAVPGGPVRRLATPLFVVLVLVETTDLVFAVDSIPAVFGVSREPFIVYTSNVFAILGLRSLFFVLDHVIGRFHLLRFGLAGVLAFVGAKMLLGHVWHVPTAMSLGVIATLLGASVVASLLIAPPAGATPEAAAADPASANPARSQAGVERTGLVTVESGPPADGANTAPPAEPAVSADRRPG